MTCSIPSESRLSQNLLKYLSRFTKRPRLVGMTYFYSSWTYGYEVKGNTSIFSGLRRIFCRIHFSELLYSWLVFHSVPQQHHAKENSELFQIVACIKMHERRKKWSHRSIERMSSTAVEAIQTSLKKRWKYLLWWILITVRNFHYFDQYSFELKFRSLNRKRWSNCKTIPNSKKAEHN